MAHLPQCSELKKFAIVAISTPSAITPTPVAPTFCGHARANFENRGTAALFSEPPSGVVCEGDYDTMADEHCLVNHCVGPRAYWHGETSNASTTGSAPTRRIAPRNPEAANRDGIGARVTSRVGGARTFFRTQGGGSSCRHTTAAVIRPGSCGPSGQSGSLDPMLRRHPSLCTPGRRPGLQTIQRGTASAIRIIALR